MTSREHSLLELAFERLKTFERDSIDRLSRLEENLRLLREDLVGDGQPGRIARLEVDVEHLRNEYHRQRGVFAGISFVVSAAIALLARFFQR